MNKFKCNNCRCEFEDENTLAYCPACCEMCEYEDTRGDEGGFIVEDEEGQAMFEDEAPPPEEPSADFDLGDNGTKDDDFYTPAAVTAPSSVSPLSVNQVSQAISGHPKPPPISVTLPSSVVTKSSMPALLSIPPMAPTVDKKRKRSLSPPDTSLCKSVWESVRNTSSMLLIGEGNFSFAYALAKRIGTARGIVATDVEMHHELRDAGGCDHTVMPLIRMGACINCITDVSQLSTSSPWRTRVRSFDFMSWAFPHTRTPNRDKNSVPEHRWLLRAFIDEAAKMLKMGGTALITVKEGYPYNSWDVSGLSTDVMEYRRGEPFFPKDFPEYRHVTTVGAPIMQITPATTHVFTKVIEPS